MANEEAIQNLLGEDWPLPVWKGRHAFLNRPCALDLHEAHWRPCYLKETGVWFNSLKLNEDWMKIIEQVFGHQQFGVGDFLVQDEKNMLYPHKENDFYDKFKVAGT